jgi:Spy/CpxP family protein refolding chaperone
MIPHPDRNSWQNPRVLLTLFTVFLMGSAFGGVVVKFGLRDVISRGAASWRPNDKVVLFQRFKTELNLTPQQAEQVEIVLDDFTMYMQSLQAQMEETRGGCRERILKILTVEQQDKFKKILGDSLKQIR